MTNGFSVEPGDLSHAASSLSTAGAALSALRAPHQIDAGRSSDEVAAAVLQLVVEASSLGTELTDVAAAFEAAARSYAATDDAVALALAGWGD